MAENNPAGNARIITWMVRKLSISKEFVQEELYTNGLPNTEWMKQQMDKGYGIRSLFSS